MALLAATALAGQTPAPDVMALAKSRLAQLDGDLEVAGLRAPVQVVRDTWGVPHISAQSGYHPDGKRIFTAFANGVNAFIAQHKDRLPIEFVITGVTPEPWTIISWRPAAPSGQRPGIG